MTNVTISVGKPATKVMTASSLAQMSLPGVNGVDQTLVEVGSLAFDDTEQANCVP